MFYCQVTIRVHIRGEVREVWFVLESKHPSLSGVFTGLKLDGMLYGNRLETTRDAEGRRVVTDRYETIINKDSIFAICEMQSDLVDEDGKVLWSFEDAAPASSAAE